MKENNFANKPIIILGTQHSGTRVVVQMLKKLGSKPGDIDNQWKEEKLFLNIHRELINKVSKKSWTSIIFDLDFVKSFKDNKEYLKYIKRRLNQEIDVHYSQRQKKPWHWKCPASALFLNSWIAIYPEAYFIHLVRDPFGVSESLLRRRQHHNPFKALRFNGLMNKRIEKCRPEMEHYLKINFELLEKQIDDLVKFLPFKVDTEKKKVALATINRKKKALWNSRYSWRKNLWQIFIRIMLFVLRLFIKKPEKI